MNAQPRAAVVDVVVNAIVSIGIFVSGWLAPVYYLNHDADLQRAPDPDFRAGAVFPIAILLGVVSKVRACRSYGRLRGLRRAAAA